jgi:hypothetical protein
MIKPVRTLTVISANNCVDRLDLLREQVRESLDSDFVTILYTHGMQGDHVYRVTENLHGAALRLHTRSNPEDVYGLAFANRDTGAKVHVILGKPVCRDPHASAVSFGGLSIPFVADEPLSAALKLADIVTICHVE